MASTTRLVSVVGALLLTVAGARTPASAARLQGTLPGDGLTLIALEPDGHAVSVPGGTFAVSVASDGGRLLVLGSDTAVRGPVVLAVKVGRKLMSVAKARAKHMCAKPNARVVTRFRSASTKPVNLGPLVVAERIVYPQRRLKPAVLDLHEGVVAADADCAPLGAGRLGLTGGAVGAARATRAQAEPPTDPGAGGAAPLPEQDGDGDGMPNAFDADDDGDGILDNDDTGSRSGPPSTDSGLRFWVFSNFHHELEASLNANAMPLTTDMVDAALRRSAGLAMQVLGDGAAVELDCGTLPYCVAGGTGRTREPYPDGIEFPEGMDADDDGLGTITAGTTSDFQYAPFGDASEETPASQLLRAGDVYRQRWTDAAGAAVEVPGMLNFVFHTTPAVKTVVAGARAYELVYPVAQGAPGTRQNPFHLPATGPASVTLTVWRPQRAGVESAGEAALVDMGNLRLVTNLPQGPCVDGPPAPHCDPGPGLCPPSAYVTVDPNLTGVNDGLQDHRGDVAADPANTFTYTIDLGACVTTVPGVTWDAGETLMVPIQMMNVYGDNAAQNVYFVRDDS